MIKRHLLRILLSDARGHDYQHEEGLRGVNRLILLSVGASR